MPVMEGIVTEETRRYQRHVDARWPPEPRQHIPPSVTPRGSIDVVENRSPVEPAPQGRSTFALPAPGSRSDLSLLLNKPRDTRHESPAAERQRYSWRMPTERPSLPSLKTVLGDSMTSPPKTPSPQTALSRPSPSQTAFDFASTEVYPSKKQRTESFDYFPRSYGSDANSCSSVGSSTPFGYPHTHYPSKHDTASQSFGARSERNEDYRKSLPPLPTPGSVTSRTSSQAFPTPQIASSSDNRPVPEDPGAYQRAHDVGPSVVQQHPRVSSNYAHDAREQGPFGQDVRENNSSQRPLARHTTTDHPIAYPSSSSREGEPPNFRPGAETWYPNPTEEGAPHPHDNHHLEQPDRSPTQHPGGSSSVPTQASPAPLPIMLSSFYDLRHPKSRKRSNLPKQSTEIMKRWFEENLTNPYPSEEQKAVFSQATGISMTQVSNWFINHRRRCPELRYIRERNRSERERDGQD